MVACAQAHVAQARDCIVTTVWLQPGRLYIGRRNASDFADRRVMRGLVSNFLHYTVSGSQS